VSKFDDLHRKIYNSDWARKIRDFIRRIFGLPPSA